MHTQNTQAFTEHKDTQHTYIYNTHITHTHSYTQHTHIYTTRKTHTYALREIIHQSGMDWGSRTLFPIDELFAPERFQIAKVSLQFSTVWEHKPAGTEAAQVKLRGF